MLARALAVAAIAIGALLATRVAPAAAVASAPYVVVFEDEAPLLSTTARLERAHGFRADHRYVAALRGFAARLTQRQRDAVAADAAVAAVHPDRPVRLVDGGGPPVAGTPAGVRRIGGGRHKSGVAIAVLDTGVDVRHPDLNVASGTNCVAPRRTAPAQDDNGHGTHVAGTIGGRETGVAPGSLLYAVKVLGADGGGTMAGVICGIDWVTASAGRLGIGVASLSLGTPGVPSSDCGRPRADALHQAICRSVRSGVVYVVAAGNSGSDLARDVPAAYREVVAVAAMADTDGLPGGRGGAPSCGGAERDDRYASFSNYATAAEDAARMLAAPGVCVRSTWPNRRYAALSGTSMAAPHVSATIALCMSVDRCRGTAVEIARRLRADATRGFVGDPDDPVAGRTYGHLVWAGSY